MIRITQDGHAPADFLARVRQEGLLDALLAQPRRLRATVATGLLNSARESSFDDLTRLAVRLLGAPVSYVSVMDRDRDFYKSHFGLAEPLATARELRCRTLCHYTLAADSVLVIEDATALSPFDAVPTVATLGVRAYIGVPMRLDGEVVASLGVTDGVPRVWTDLEIETLRQLGASGERELQLREALARAHAEAERARHLALAREALVSALAHDLRTPMQIIQLCMTRLQTALPTSEQRWGERLSQALRNMRVMADDLLAAQANEQAGFFPRPLSLATLVGDALKMMQPLAEREGIHLMSSSVDEGEVMGDHGQLIRALGNLIGNAVKFCPTGSEVRVGARRTGDRVDLMVQDNGPGISAEAQDHIWDPGWQGADSMHRGDGSGLGLVIVRQIITRHGGEVLLASNPGQGCCFTLRLPSGGERLGA